VYSYRPITALIFLVFLLLFFALYIWFLYQGEKKLSKKNLLILIVFISLLFIFSFPAFSYDIFNYITTAKVAFFHHENPWLVMPIELTGDPYLAFTRAANKVALYGPVWILTTAIPHFLGNGNIWQTIITFKGLNTLLYLFVSFLVYKMTKSVKNVLVFALNPLVLIEVLVSSHNDILMMACILLGIHAWFAKGIGKKIMGILALFGSVFVKGASVVLLPLLFIKHLTKEQFLELTYVLLAIVFFVAAPLREELYPWYGVWLVTIAACFDIKKHTLLLWGTIVLSFALELRHLPYMYMGYYEGIGPLLRTLFTVLPMLGFGVYVLYRKLLKNK